MGIKDHAREIRLIKNQEYEKYMQQVKEAKRESEERNRPMQSLLNRHCMTASVEDYEDWLAVYTASINGNNPFTKSFNRPFSRDNWYCAISDFTLPPVYGSRAIHIIVPKGIIVTVERDSHNNVYYFDEPYLFPLHGEVPCYSDF